MPMTLACFDMDDIADRDLALLGFRCRKTFARRDDENLIAVVDMPAGRRADSEIDHVAAEILRLPVADNRLPSPAHRPAAPSGDRRRRVHRFFWQIINLKYAHGKSPFVTSPELHPWRANRQADSAVNVR